MRARITHFHTLKTGSGQLYFRAAVLKQGARTPNGALKDFRKMLKQAKLTNPNIYAMNYLEY